MNRGRAFVLLGSLFAAALLTRMEPALAQTPLELDERQLKTLELPTSNEALLEYFRRRMARAEERPALEKLVRQLGSEIHNERENAARELLLRGPAALPLLQAALKDPSVEVTRRAEACIRKIESASSNEALAVAARVLAERRAPGAGEVLLEYVAEVTDPPLLDDFLPILGRLTIAPGKVEPLLLEAARDAVSARRAVAAYLLGRRGDFNTRSVCRGLLEDSDAVVRQRALEGLAGKRVVQSLQEAKPTDEPLLQGTKVEPTEPSVLAFLRKRTLDEKDQRRLRQLVTDLGSESYADRERANRLLYEEGTPALAFLKPAEADPDIEVVRRVQNCIDLIRRGPGPALPMAAVHVLGRLPEGAAPSAAINALIDYVPFADDDAVEDEVLHALTVLSLRGSKLEPRLVQALEDALPARRGAAAYVLGHVGLPSHQAALRRLLDDGDALVRLRAAQGLLAAHDAVAVPRIIALLDDLPMAMVGRAEDVLYRLAGDKAPTDAATIHAAQDRPRAVKAWDQWWKDNSARADLTRVTGSDSYLGLVTVCEYDAPNGQPGGQVWEAQRDAKPRWKLGGLQGAMDAQVLPSGRVLIAENSANRVTERDTQNRIVWEYRVPGNPIACQRLPNGNTFIALYNQVLEVTQEGKEVYRHTPGPQFYVFGAHKARNGNIVAITAQGAIVELDAPTGKQIRSINLGANGNWCGIEALPNGNYLVATMNNKQVREITPENKIVWSAEYDGVFRASRLPNGNTLVASMTTRRVAELDRSGNRVWERTCEGRPWAVHYR